jgi:hypothetical protein
MFNNRDVIESILSNQTQYDVIFKNEYLMDKIQYSNIAISVLIGLDNLNEIVDSYPLVKKSIQKYLSNTSTKFSGNMNIYVQDDEPDEKDGIWIQSNAEFEDGQPPFIINRENNISYSTEDYSNLFGNTDSLYNAVYNTKNNRLYFTSGLGNTEIQYISSGTENTEPISSGVTLTSNCYGNAIDIDGDNIMYIGNNTTEDNLSTLTYEIYNIPTNTLSELSTIGTKYLYNLSSLGHHQKSIWYNKKILYYIGVSDSLVTDTTISSSQLILYKYNLNVKTVSSTYDSSICHDNKQNISTTNGMYTYRCTPIGLIDRYFYILCAKGKYESSVYKLQYNVYRYDTTIIGEQTAKSIIQYNDIVDTEANIISVLNTIKNSIVISFFNKLYFYNLYAMKDFWVLYDYIITGSSENRPSSFIDDVNYIPMQNDNKLIITNNTYKPTNIINFTPSDLLPYPEGVVGVYGSKIKTKLTNTTTAYFDNILYVKYGIIRDTSIYVGDGTEWTGNELSTDWGTILSNSTEEEIEAYLNDSVVRTDIYASTTGLSVLTSNAVTMSYIASSSTLMDSVIENTSVIDTFLTHTTSIDILMGTENSITKMSNNTYIIDKIINTSTLRDYFKSNDVTKRVLSLSELFMERIGVNIGTLGIFINTSDYASILASSQTFMNSSSLDTLLSDATMATTFLGYSGARTFMFNDTSILNKIFTKSTLLTNISKNSTISTDIINNDTWITAFLNNSSARSAMYANTTSRNLIANNSTIMTNIINNSTWLNALLSSTTYVAGFVGIETARNLLLGSTEVVNSIISSSTASAGVADSSSAMDYVISNNTLLSTFLGNTTSSTQLLTRSNSTTKLYADVDRINNILTTTSTADIIKSNSSAANYLVSTSLFITNLFDHSSYSGSWWTIVKNNASETNKQLITFLLSKDSFWTKLAYHDGSSFSYVSKANNIFANTTIFDIAYTQYCKSAIYIPSNVKQFFILNRIVYYYSYNSPLDICSNIRSNYYDISSTALSNLSDADKIIVNSLFTFDGFGYWSSSLSNINTSEDYKYTSFTLSLSTRKMYFIGEGALRANTSNTVNPCYTYYTTTTGDPYVNGYIEMYRCSAYDKSIYTDDFMKFRIHSNVGFEKSDNTDLGWYGISSMYVRAEVPPGTQLSGTIYLPYYSITAKAI